MVSVRQLHLDRSAASLTMAAEPHPEKDMELSVRREDHSSGTFSPGLKRAYRSRTNLTFSCDIARAAADPQGRIDLTFEESLRQRTPSSVLAFTFAWKVVAPSSWSLTRHFPFALVRSRPNS